MRRALAALVFITWPSPAAGIPGKPGEEAEVAWKDLAHPLVVYLPENYTPERKWPVVFHYHGTNGLPTVGQPKRYTGGRDFVLVGMEYVTRGKAPPTVDYLALEIELLREVRAWLAEKVSIEPKRTIVGGFSKGGWVTSEMAEVYSSDFAGVYILGAGKNWRNVRKAVPIRNKLPVYIGIGQFDPNNPYSVRAAGYFRELGAVSFLDEYLAEAHTLPMRTRSEPFVQWWRLLAGGDGLQGEARDWVKGEIVRSRADDDPLHAFLRLDRAKRAPFAVRLSTAEREFLEKEWKAAGRALGEEERMARGKYEANRTIEAKSPTLEDLQKVARAYFRIHVDYPESFHGRRAAVDYTRLRETVTEVKREMFRDEATMRHYFEELGKNPLPEPSGPVDREFFRKTGAALAE